MQENTEKTINKKEKKKSNLVSNLLLVVAIGMFAVAGFKIYEYVHDINTQKRNGAISLLEAQRVIDEGADFEGIPMEGTVLGTVELVGLTGPLPILMGEDEDIVLAHGVGLLNESAFPGNNKQVFLSAHRETFFVQLRNVQIGDIVRVTMPNGVFDYRVSHTRIVHETASNDVLNFNQLEQDELVLMTCYPFNFWDTSVERYLVYAYPIN